MLPNRLRTVSEPRAWPAENRDESTRLVFQMDGTWVVSGLPRAWLAVSRPCYDDEETGVRLGGKPT
jgi:hypothetical protein